MNFKIKGLIAAPFTPFTTNDAIAYEQIPSLAQLAAGDGLAGVFIGGTTGEGLSLTAEERRLMAETWIRSVPEGFPVIVHVGHCSLHVARDLAVHASSIGAKAISAIGPLFYRPGSVEDLVWYCRQLAAAAPDLPFYYYHIPGQTDIRFPMADFLRVAHERIPNLAGVKFSHDDLLDFQRCLAFGQGRYDLLFGRDEFLLSAVVLGAEGAVGSTYNFMAPVYHRLLQHLLQGRIVEARREQRRSSEIVGCLQRRGFLAAAKSLMKLRGVDCGPVRPPIRPLAEEEIAGLWEELRNLGWPEADGDLAGSAGSLSQG